MTRPNPPAALTHSFRAASAFCLFLITGSPAAADTLIVDASGIGDFTTIQAAVDASSDGDRIEVNPGVYQESVDFLGKDIVVASTEGSDVTTISPPLDTGTCVIFVSNEPPSALLEGFNLVNGTGTLHVDRLAGGGVYCVGASPTIRNCRFAGHVTEEGGGLFLDESTARIEACVFEGNQSVFYGSGIRGGAAAHPHILDCHFEDNESGRDGTVYIIAPYWIERCVFVENRARNGGGIELPLAGSDATILDCWFEGNRATGNHGGGIRVHEASPTIIGCVFLDNWAVQDGGGFLSLDGGVPILENCTFFGNGSGRNGGTIAAWYGSSPIVEQCILAATTSKSAAFTQNASIDFRCNDFWNNTEGDFGGQSPDVIGVDGNFSADPLFCAPTSGNFFIAYSSPCSPRDAASVQDCGLIGAKKANCESAEEDSPIAESGTEWMNDSVVPGGTENSSPPFPNPASDQVSFQVDLESPGSIALGLFAVDGRTVRSIPRATFAEGVHEISMEVTDLPTGIYYLRVRKTMVDGSHEIVRGYRVVIR